MRTTVNGALATGITLTSLVSLLHVVSPDTFL